MLMNVDLASRMLARLVHRVAEVEEVELANAVGRVAAENITAPINLPPFDASAMDGYAVNAAGLNHQRLKRFDVVGESLAGHPAQCQISGKAAIRIFTGAVLPAGANAVILQEHISRQGDTVVTTEPVRADQHVRRRGHDVRRSAPLCPAGTRLSAYDLSWLAACGINSVRVTRQIRAAIFSTGDELADAGQPLGDGQIYDSNRVAIASLLREKTAQVIDLGRLPDDPDVIRNTLRDAARRADLIVTSGGVSVGDADFVKAIVEEIGVINFWKLALKPGKPLAVGSVDETLFFGLPGNPVSTIVTYLLFVAPAVDLLGGQRPAPPLTLPATINQHIKRSPGRKEYMRGIANADGDGLVVAITGDQSSNRLATFANANCLVVIDETVGDLEPGDSVRVMLLSGEAAHPLREVVA